VSRGLIRPATKAERAMIDAFVVTDAVGLPRRRRRA
jgi:hypothetical protein